MWLQFWAGEREDKSTSQTAQNTNPASSLSKQVMQDSSHWICSSPGILGHDEHTNIAPVCPSCVSSGPRHNLLYLKLCSILTSPTLSRLPWLRCRPSTWICWTSRVHWAHCSACQVSLMASHASGALTASHSLESSATCWGCRLNTQQTSAGPHS